MGFGWNEDDMGILGRIKNRLKIVAGAEPRPANSFSTAAPQTAPREPAPPPKPPMTAEEATAQIDADVKAHKVLIFLKGTRTAPMCGFSAAVIDVFDQLGVPYETRNVLEEPAIRTAIKDYSDWPTIPQVYVNHEFIGGCDITRQMHESGELKTAVDKALEA